MGVVGMCFSGGFALAAAGGSSVLAAVGSQPSIPFPVGNNRRRDLGMSEVEAAAIDARTSAGLCMLGLRFSQDPVSPKDRFAALRDRFGDAFEVFEIDSGLGSSHGIGKRAHAVLTEEFVDEPDHPTRHAYDRVVAFLHKQLG